jgi:hypothetical protein
LTATHENAKQERLAPFPPRKLCSGSWMKNMLLLLLPKQRRKTVQHKMQR